MKIAKIDEFGELTCPYCGLIIPERHKLITGIAKCLGCRGEFKIIEKDRYEDCIGDNWPIH